MGALALFVALGGTALAATGSIVNIADPSNVAHVAHVDSAGKLLVGDGSGNLSVDGTVTAQPAAASTLWHASGAGGTSCSAIATPPTGRAVILRSITLNLYSAPAGSLSGGNFIAVYNNSTCAGTPIWDMTPTQLGPTTMQFEAGIGIPSTGALSVWDYNGAGYGFEAYGTGFTVSAAAVPSPAAASAQRSRSHSGPPAAASG